MKTHHYDPLYIDDRLDSCKHKEPVIYGYEAQCGEAKNAAIHQPPFGLKLTETQKRILNRPSGPQNLTQIADNTFQVDVDMGAIERRVAARVIAETEREMERALAHTLRQVLDSWTSGMPLDPQVEQVGRELIKEVLG